MKSTQERLSQVYCVPKTANNWINLLGFDQSGHAEFCKYSNNLGAIPSDNTIGRTTEIPVSHFIDLLNDSIVAWRLEEDGFDVSRLPYLKHIQGQWDEHIIGVTETGKFVFIHGKQMNVTTYTDLLTLIRLIG